jgi:hypothetical protein
MLFVGAIESLKGYGSESTDPATVRQILDIELGDQFTVGELENSDGSIHQFEVPADPAVRQTFHLIVRCAQERATVRFEVSPDYAEKRVVFDGSLFDVDIDQLSAIMDYTFVVMKEALEISHETLFSEREAEVFVMLREGYSVDEILECSTIWSASDIRAYVDRIEEQRVDALFARGKAEKTLDQLNSVDSLL